MQKLTIFIGSQRVYMGIIEFISHNYDNYDNIKKHFKTVSVLRIIYTTKTKK